MDKTKEMKHETLQSWNAKCKADIGKWKRFVFIKKSPNETKASNHD